MFFGGGGGRSLGSFPVGSFALASCREQVAGRAGVEAAAFWIQMSLGFARVEGEPLEKSLSAAGVSAAAF